MSASSSRSSQTTSTTSDSYNQTFNKVFNLSNAGNVNISAPPDNTLSLMPWILGAVGIVALAVMLK